MKKLLFTAAMLTVFSGAYSAQALIPGVPVLETEVGYGYKRGTVQKTVSTAPISKFRLSVKLLSVRNTDTGIMAEMKRIFTPSINWAMYTLVWATEIIMTETQKFTDFWKEEQMS